MSRLDDLYARIDLTSRAVGLFSGVAEAYVADGFPSKAVAIYKKIVKLDPTRLEIYERLAELYQAMGLVDAARMQYQVLLEYVLGRGNVEMATAICRIMIGLEPQSADYEALLRELLKLETVRASFATSMSFERPASS